MRALVFRMALRYFRGLRSANLVPILSRISMVAIGVSTAAMIILFSIMNGFEFLIQDLYKAFYPPLRISSNQGKFFQLPEDKREGLRAIRDLENLSEVLEDQVLLTHFDEQKIAVVKGVDEHYFKVNPLERYLVEGEARVWRGEEPNAILGLQLANDLGIELHHIFSYFDIYYPNAKGGQGVSGLSALRSQRLVPTATFQVQDEFDAQFVLADIEVIRSLLGREGDYSSLEIRIREGADASRVQSDIRDLLGEGYRVETLYEQNQSLFMVMKMEKWAIYAILVLVMLIASFNMVGGLTMLALEKKKDMAIMRVMGAPPGFIRSLFITEGLIWAMVGGLGGLILGWLLCLGQAHYGWIRLSGSFIISAYPVRILFSDFLLILTTVAGVGLLAAAYPASRASRLGFS